jgi:hypothetical protein
VALQCAVVVADDTACCDRSVLRTDVCIMCGDVRTHAASKSNSLFLLLQAVSSTRRPAPPLTEIT